MSGSITLFTLLNTSTLEKVVESFQEEFNILLEDCFTDDELTVFEKKIDAMGAIYVQPILSDLSFDDFYFSEDQEIKQRFFFESAKSSILLENLPYLESNPFQVSYLLELLKKFDEVLIDRGGVNDLMFKEDFLRILENLKSMDSIAPAAPPPKMETKTTAPVDPIDFLIRDVYQEIERTRNVVLPLEDLSPKVQKVFHIMKENKLDASELLRASGLIAKDFDDNLERLKFWLRKFQ